jgi:hypothetical protein
VRVAGISTKMLSKGRPSVRFVVVTDRQALGVGDELTLPSDDVELPEKLHDTAEAIRSRLVGLTVDRVVVRRADRAPVPSNQEGPRIRLLTEGAVVSAARSVVVQTFVATGKEAAEWYGSNKAALDADASKLAKSCGLDDTIYREAVAAALAGLKL